MKTRSVSLDDALDHPREFPSFPLFLPLILHLHHRHHHAFKQLRQPWVSLGINSSAPPSTSSLIIDVYSLPTRTTQGEIDDAYAVDRLGQLLHPMR